MNRLFGLTRDPFAPVCDDALYWESPVRARVRRRAAEALARRRGVWLAGPPGSGRSTLLDRLAEDAALTGAAVAIVRDVVPPSGPDLLALLLAVLGEPIEAADTTSRAAALYRALLDAFCRAGPPVLALDLPALGPDARRELELLAGFKVAGRPLVALILAGGRRWPELEEVVLETPTPPEVAACLSHRSAACGRPDLLSAADLKAIAARAEGFGEALALARQVLGHRAFRGGEPGVLPPLAPSAVLPEEDLGEVERLLASLSPSV